MYCGVDWCIVVVVGYVDGELCVYFLIRVMLMG